MSVVFYQLWQSSVTKSGTGLKNFTSFLLPYLRTIAPLKNISIYPSVKKILAQLEKDTLVIICSCHFHEENVCQGKIERVYIQSKMEGVY